jgi:hypothetical protein
MRLLARLLFLAALLTGSLPAAPTAWAKLKVGMTADETALLLGAPLGRTQGHGFEKWTYDQGAEVLLHGGIAVIGWTVPVALRLAVRSLDIWSDAPTRDRYFAICADRAAIERRRAGPGRKMSAAGLVYEDYVRGQNDR